MVRAYTPFSSHPPFHSKLVTCTIHDLLCPSSVDSLCPTPGSSQPGRHGHRVGPECPGHKDRLEFQDTLCPNPVDSLFSTSGSPQPGRHDHRDCPECPGFRVRLETMVKTLSLLSMVRMKNPHTPIFIFSQTRRRAPAHETNGVRW